MLEKKTARPPDPAGDDPAHLDAWLWRRSLVESARPAQPTWLDGRRDHAEVAGADSCPGRPRSQGPGLLWPAGTARATAGRPDVAPLCHGPPGECRHHRVSGMVLCTARGPRLHGPALDLGQRLLAS